MGKNYNRLSAAIPATNYTKAQFETDLKELGPTTLYENLTGAGALSLDYKVSHLNQTSGSYAMTLPDGIEEGEEKEIYHVGTGGTFTLTGTFQDWTTLTFSTIGRSAKLIWVNGKWVFVWGTAEAE